MVCVRRRFPRQLPVPVARRSEALGCDGDGGQPLGAATQARQVVRPRDRRSYDPRMPTAQRSFTLLLVLLAACSSSPPTGKADDSVAWMPASARSPQVLDDERQSPNVVSSLPPGTRVQL